MSRFRLFRVVAQEALAVAAGVPAATVASAPAAAATTTYARARTGWISHGYGINATGQATGGAPGLTVAAHVTVHSREPSL